VVFGARTVLFGLSELITAVRGPAAVEEPESTKRPGTVRRWLSVAGAGIALVVALVLGV